MTPEEERSERGEVFGRLFLIVVCMAVLAVMAWGGGK